jgi:hypothetical protein
MEAAKAASERREDMRDLIQNEAHRVQINKMFRPATREEAIVSAREYIGRKKRGRFGFYVALSAISSILVASVLWH